LANFDRKARIVWLSHCLTHALFGCQYDSVLWFLQVKVVDKTDGLPEHDVDLDALLKDFPELE